MEKQSSFRTNIGECHINCDTIEIKNNTKIGKVLSVLFSESMQKLRIFYVLLIITSLYCIYDDISSGKETFTIVNTSTYALWFTVLIVPTFGKTLVTTIQREDITNVTFSKGLFGVKN